MLCIQTVIDLSISCVLTTFNKEEDDDDDDVCKVRAFCLFSAAALSLHPKNIRNGCLSLLAPWKFIAVYVAM